MSEQRAEDIDDTALMVEVARGDTVAFERLIERHQALVIGKAIRALPEKQRMAVVLRRYEGKSYEEIGEVLGLTVAAVKSLLFRARTELRAALNRYLEK